MCLQNAVIVSLSVSGVCGRVLTPAPFTPPQLAKQHTAQAQGSISQTDTWRDVACIADPKAIVSD